MRDKEQADDYAPQARHQGHVACHLNGISTAFINSVDGEKPDVGIE